MISGKLYIYLSESRIVISISILCRISFCPRRLSNGDGKDRRMVARVIVRKMARKESFWEENETHQHRFWSVSTPQENVATYDIWEYGGIVFKIQNQDDILILWTITSPCSYPCKWVGQSVISESVIDSFSLEIAIASPSFGSLFGFHIFICVI